MNAALGIACLSMALFADDPKQAAPPDPAQQKDESREYKAAYAKARADAEKAVKEGRAVFFTYGLRMMGDNLDRPTGLPLDPIAGCLVNDEILGRAAGNNDYLNEYVLKNGPPANSFKKWDKQIYDLKAYVAAQRAKQSLRPLAVQGPAAKSPDGNYSIRAVPSAEKGAPANLVLYALTANGKDVAPARAYLMDDPAEAVWGPEGSGFVVLAGRLAGSEVYEAIDARTGNVLRHEFHEDGRTIKPIVIPSTPGA